MFRAKNAYNDILRLCAVSSSGASAISEGDIFIYSCSAQLISLEVDSISKEINCAEHDYMNKTPSLIALAPLLPVSGVYSNSDCSRTIKEISLYRNILMALFRVHWVVLSSKLLRQSL